MLFDHEYKVGDKVVVDGSNTSVVGEVVRITPKGFIVVQPYGNAKYTYTFRADGFERTSDMWHKRTIRPLTQKDIELRELADARRTAKAHFERCYPFLSKSQADEITKMLEGLGRDNV